MWEIIHRSDPTDWIKNKTAAISFINKRYHKYAVTVALNHEIKKG